MARKKSVENGYYDPQLGEFIAAAPAAAGEAVRGVRRGYSRVLETARKVPFFKKYEVYFKLLVVLVIWALGVYIIYQITKSAIGQALAATSAAVTSPNFPIVMSMNPITGFTLLVFNGVGAFFGLPNIFAPPTPTPPTTATQPTPQQETAITNIVNTMTNPYIMIWSLICLVIGLYVFGSTPRPESD